MYISNELLLWRVHVTKILVVCFISCATLVAVLYHEHDGKTYIERERERDLDPET